MYLNHLKHLNALNLQICLNPSKFGFLGISKGRGSFGGPSDVLMSWSWGRRCPGILMSHSDVPLPDDHARVRTIGQKKRVCWCHHRHWCRCGSPDEMPCVPKSIHPGVSWTKITLAAWSRGFLTWWGPWHGGATGAHRSSQLSEMHYL